MRRSRKVFGKIAIALALFATTSAQTRDVPEAPGVPVQAQESGAVAHFRFGSSLELRTGDRAEEVVVILGSATINGTVEGDVFVVLGSLELGRTSVIEGDAVVVGGSIKVLPGAVAEGEVVMVGGVLDASVEFLPAGALAVVGVGPGPTEVFASVFAWFTKGLLRGRLLVPELLWTWILVVVFALVYLATNSIFERPVRDVAAALASKPLTCFLVGGLVVLLIGPVSLLLASSVVGLPTVPILWFAVFLTIVMGKVGVTRWIGGRIMPEQLPGDRAEAARSVAIGFAVVSVAYMVPVLGLAAWTVLGFVALGAATITVATRLRRENPKPPGSGRIPAVAISQADSAEALEPEQPPSKGVDQPESKSGVGEAAQLDRGPQAELPLAAFPARIGAVALDFVPFALMCHMLHIGTALTLLLFVVYNSAMWAWRGTTVGGMICRIRLIRTDGQNWLYETGLFGAWPVWFRLRSWGWAGCGRRGTKRDRLGMTVLQERMFCESQLSERFRRSISIGCRRAIDDTLSMRLLDSNPSEGTMTRTNLIVCCTAVLAVALAGPVLAVEPTCDLSLQGNGYIVCYEEGYEADAKATRTILDEQAIRLEAKYGGPIPSSLTVKLYAKPARGVSSVGAHYSVGSDTIHVLAASAPYRDQGWVTVDGLQIDDPQLIKSMLVHEYVHAFHRARAPGTFGWAGRAWFIEAFAEYEALFEVDSVRERRLPRMIAFVSDEGREKIGCCQSAAAGPPKLFIEDQYAGGPTMFAFLSDTLGLDFVKDILLSERLTAEDALDDALVARGLDLSHLFADFPAWLDALDEELRLDYTPNVAFRSCQKKSSSEIEIRMRASLFNAEIPSITDGKWLSRARVGPDGGWLVSAHRSPMTARNVVRATAYLAHDAEYPSLQIQVAGCGKQCTRWSNIVELSTSTCSAQHPATTQEQDNGLQPAHQLQCGTAAF